MSALNQNFINLKKEERKEFRAVPPEKDFIVYANENKLVVNDKKNPHDITNGDYIANSSSETIWPPTHSAIHAFDNKRESFWHTPWSHGFGYKQDPYYSGKYIGGGNPNQYYTTTTTTGEVLAGEWIEIKLPYRLRMTKYEILTATHCCPERFPTRFTVLGSTDGTNWVILDQQQIQGNPLDKFDVNRPVPFEISNQISSYNIFRIVFEGLVNNNWPSSMAISLINIYGVFPCINVMGQCDDIPTYSNNITSNIEGMSLMENEMKLLADLKEFNTKYDRYIKCSKNSNGCTNAELDVNYINDAYDKLIGSIDIVSRSYGNDVITNDQYDVSHNEIQKTHNQNIKLRQELDAKLKEIYATDDSIAAEHKRMFDGTVYTNLVWTILATSTLFYVFKHL
jgi:hypothetical protein